MNTFIQKNKKGYAAYCGMLLMDAQYNNPVATVFLQQIQESVRHKGNPLLLSSFSLYLVFSFLRLIDHLEWHIEYLREDVGGGAFGATEEGGDILSSSNSVTLRRKRARMRWHLWVTLVNNPSLMEMRRRPWQEQSEPAKGKGLFASLSTLYSSSKGSEEGKGKERRKE